MSDGPSIPFTRIATISIQTRSRVSNDAELLRIVQKAINKELRQLKQGLLSPRGSPREHPSNPVPKAGAAYRPVLKNRKKRKAKIAPGRLRRIAGMGFIYTTSTAQPTRFQTSPTKALMGFHRGAPIKVFWGIPQFPGNFINYAKWVARMAGGATGGGGRFNWDVRFRKWLKQRIRQITRSVNQSLKLTGREALVVF